MCLIKQYIKKVMHEVETKQGKHKVKFYDSIRHLPMRRYQKFNKHMMIASQVGESVGDYDVRMSRAIRYLNADDKKSAVIELTNQRQCVFNAMQEYTPKGMALAVMVHSIDDVVYSDFQEETLSEIQDKLDSIGFTIDDLDTTIETVKKKSRTNYIHTMLVGLKKTLISWLPSSNS